MFAKADPKKLLWMYKEPQIRKFQYLALKVLDSEMFPK